MKIHCSITGGGHVDSPKAANDYSENCGHGGIIGGKTHASAGGATTFVRASNGHIGGLEKCESGHVDTVDGIGHIDCQCAGGGSTYNLAA